MVAGTNFTECADRALLFAINYFGAQNVNVTLAYCLVELMDATDLHDEFADTVPANIPLEKRFAKKLSDKQHWLHGLFGAGLVTDSCILHGYPEEVLPAFAAQLNADIVVVGDTCRPNSVTEFLGSKVSDIIKKSVVPVLSVPLDYEGLPLAMGSVLYLTDFRESDFSSLHQFIQWLPQLNATVRCVHYCHEKPDKWDLSRVEELQAYCLQTYRNHQVVCDILRGGHQVSDLVQYIVTHQIKLVGITRKHRHSIAQWLRPDVAVKLLVYAPVPMIVFCD